MRHPVEKLSAMKCQGMLVLPDNKLAVETTLDTGAELNVIDPKLALQLQLPIAAAALPKMPAWGDGKVVHCYGAYLIVWEAQDTRGRRTQETHVVYALEHAGTPLILGMPGLAKQRVVCDAETQAWYFKEGPLNISLITAGELENELEGGSYVWFVQDMSGLTDGARDEGDMPAIRVVPAEFARFADVFDEEAAVKQPPHPDAEHAIETNGPPPFGPIYPQSARELEELRRYIAEAQANRWIRPSVSPAGAPILFVPKADGSMRLCVDYRGLNKVTIKNRHPLPLINEILDRLSGAGMFTKLDLKWAYHRIRIRRGDEWKTAFRTRYGHYEYLVMPFGLTNAPATFQAYINKALGELVDVICIVYLDDIIIYSRNRDEHEEHVARVLERLRVFGLFCNLQKCRFFETEVEFLGYRIATEGVKMDPRKVESITTWPKPQSYNELQIFLGFCNFYRRFIASYSRMVSPMTDLLKGSVNGKKEGPFEWSDSAEQAFRTLIDAFTKAPVLIHFDPVRRIRVETDASAFAAAAILSQLVEETGQWHPVAFWSRKFIPAERNYETHDQELLAIVAAFKHWRHYLEGSTQPIEVITDHHNLVGFTKIKQLNGRQARWAMTLSTYDFTITHRAGKLNPADAPSRRPDYDDGEKASNQMLPTLFAKLNIEPEKSLVGALLAGKALATHRRADGTDRQEYPDLREVRDENAARRREASGATADRLSRRLPKRYQIPVGNGDDEVTSWDAGGEPVMRRSEVILALSTNGAYDEEPESLRTLIKEAQEASTEAQGIRQKLEEQLHSEKRKPTLWTLENGLLRHKGRIYVPPVRAAREELMKRMHDDPYAGHFGILRTAELLGRRYHWPGMGEDVAAYVKTCDVCQKTKVKRHRPYGEMQALPSPDGPWKEIALDFMSGVPLSMRGGVAYDAILVVVDRYSKMALYFPVSKTITAVETADLLIDNVFTRFGFPSGMVSDRDPRFTSQFWSDLCYYAKITKRMSTAFHPQTDGQTERQNQTLQEYLRSFCTTCQTKWAAKLPIAEFAYNNSVHSAHGHTPFRVVLGYDPQVYFDTEDSVTGGRVPAAEERIRQIANLRAELQQRLRDASVAQAKYYNMKHLPLTFKKGDLVLISTKNLRLKVPSTKMAQRRMGPYRIDEPVGSQAYRVHLPADSRIHNVFHVSALEPYQSREGEQEVLPPPELIDDEEEYEVEEVIGKRQRQGIAYYLVKWKGWPKEYNQWVPEQDISNAKALVQDFEKQKRSGTKESRSRGGRVTKSRGKRR
jgi:hypothetical protein